LAAASPDVLPFTKVSVPLVLDTLLVVKTKSCRLQVLLAVTEDDVVALVVVVDDGPRPSTAAPPPLDFASWSIEIVRRDAAAIFDARA